MAESNNKNNPPLVDVKVTNPIEYIKIWWNRIIGNEGVDFSFHIRPLTAIAISIAIASIGFGLGRFSLPFDIPFFHFEINPSATPHSSTSPDQWRETGFTGTLQYSTSSKKYYLITTSSSEAITLELPTNIDVADLVGTRIFVTGNYNKSSRVLIVYDTKSLEILPKSPLPVPTVTPSSSPTQTPLESPVTY